MWNLNRIKDFYLIFCQGLFLRIARTSVMINFDQNLQNPQIKSRIQSGSSHREVFVKSRQNFWKFIWRIFLKILKKELPHRFKGFGHVFQYLLWYPRTPGQREEVQLPEVYSGSLPTSSMKIFVTIVNS